MSKRMTVSDFFCGAGGFSEGFRQMGFEVVFALDNWKPAVETHELNHPDCRCSCSDILDLDTPEKIDALVPDTDVIIGSPPCVAFSGSNKAGKADKTLGIKLIEAYLRIIAWKKRKGALKYWVLENVPNSGKFIKDSYTWKELGLPGNGPSLNIKNRNIFNAADFGAPQTRKRFFCGDYPTPRPTHQGSWITISQIMDVLGDPLDGEREKIVKDPCYHELSMKRSDITDHFYDTRVEDFEWNSAKRLKVDHGFMGKMSFPEDINRSSRTIMATRSASTREAMIFGATKNKRGEFDSFRMPTIREISCFMSFPLTYQFQGNSEGTKYKLVGNAVCCKMSAAVARAIAEDAKMSIPNKIDFSHRPFPKINLNDMKINKKTARPKNLESRFIMHVPYLKTNGFRVELTNEQSDFKNGKIKWSCVLHHGTGSSAKKCHIEKDIDDMMTTSDNFKSFKKDLDDISNRIPDAKRFQELYCRIVEDNKMLEPSEALNSIKNMIDKHYPEDDFQSHKTYNFYGKIRIGKTTIPTRIMAAVYACQNVAKKANDTKFKV